MNEFEVKLEQRLKDMFANESSGHDPNHLKRVYNLATRIQDQEGGDRLVIGAAAFLHDLHRLMGKDRGKYCDPKESLPLVEKLLKEVEFPATKIPPVLHCVEFHEEYAFSDQGKTVTDLETLIIQDADNLDAIGAIGIGRTFTFGGAHGVPMWVPERPFDRDTYDEAVGDPSTIHHFYSKLLKLKDNMNTETGKRMAEARHEFMELFLDHFFKEWKGEL